MTLDHLPYTIKYKIISYQLYFFMNQILKFNSLVAVPTILQVFNF